MCDSTLRVAFGHINAMGEVSYRYYKPSGDLGDISNGKFSKQLLKSINLRLEDIIDVKIEEVKVLEVRKVNIDVVKYNHLKRLRKINIKNLKEFKKVYHQSRGVHLRSCIQSSISLTRNKLSGIEKSILEYKRKVKGDG